MFQSGFHDRCNEFVPFWTALVAAIPDPVERSLMPNSVDACNMPPIKAMLSEGNAQIPISKERWLAIIGLIPSEVEKFQAEVKRTLADHLKTKGPQIYVREIQEDASDDCDLSVLAKATTLFTCQYDRCNEPIGYPGIFSHIHLNGLTWSRIIDLLLYEDAVEPTVEMVLKVLGLPEDTSLAAMEELDGRLMCLCGHPRFREPMSFKSLVRGGLVFHLPYLNF